MVLVYRNVCLRHRMFNEGQDAQNCEKDVYVNVDEQDVLKHDVDEMLVLIGRYFIAKDNI